MVSGHTPVNYYMCADLHFYESGILTITNTDDNSSFQVKQIISGTGGAELDTPNSPGHLSRSISMSILDNTHTFELELVTYDVNRSHGYVIVEDAHNDGQLNITFNPVEIDELKETKQSDAERKRIIRKKTKKRTKRKHTRKHTRKHKSNCKSKQKKRNHTRKIL